MKLLAIETSTLAGSVAIMEDRRTLYEQLLGLREDHSARLMSAIDAALAHVGWTPRDVDAYALAIGPGSFTSLRVGLATLKGLCFAAGTPIVTVPTLDAMAWAFPDCRWRICPMIDARMKEVYGAVYEWQDGTITKLTPDLVSTVENVFGDFMDLPILCFGTGSNLYRDRIETALGDHARFVDESLGMPRASRVAMLASEKFGRGDTADIDLLEPVYLRKSEAERVRNQRRANTDNPLS